MIGKQTREALYVHATVIMPLPFTSYTEGVDPNDLVRWYSDACFACDVCEEQGVNDVPMTRGGFPCLDDNWLVKYARNRDVVSFLYYPNFLTDPHPALAKAVTIDLDKQTVKVRSYAGTDNPPILHRKEEFVALNFPLRDEFTTITHLEEDKGLYAKETLHTIGTRKGWETVCAAHRRLRVPGAGGSHVMLQRASALTAIPRKALSVPAKLAFQYGVIRPGVAVLDYGCGRGDDVRFLRKLGVGAIGYDPHLNTGFTFNRLQRDGDRYDVVLCSYVLCTLPTVRERMRVLRRAFRHAKGALVIGVRTDFNTLKKAKPHLDGFVTAKGTFQRPYHAVEFRAFVEKTLHCPVRQLAPGVVVVTRKSTDRKGQE